jgi:hypothetical protein
MAKDKIRFVCQSCGAAHAKWQGRCDACGEWNTLVEEAPAARGPGPASKGGPGQGVASNGDRDKHHAPHEYIFPPDHDYVAMSARGGRLPSDDYCTEYSDEDDDA